MKKEFIYPTKFLNLIRVNKKIEKKFDQKRIFQIFIMYVLLTQVYNVYSIVSILLIKF